MLDIRVQPRSSRDEVVGITQGRLKVRVTAPPIDNAANESLKAFLAKEFGVSRARVRIISGQKRREKRIAVKKPKRTPVWLNECGATAGAGNGA